MGEGGRWEVGEVGGAGVFYCKMCEGDTQDKKNEGYLLLLVRAKKKIISRLIMSWPSGTVKS